MVPIIKTHHVLILLISKKLWMSSKKDQYIQCVRVIFAGILQETSSVHLTALTPTARSTSSSPDPPFVVISSESPGSSSFVLAINLTVLPQSDLSLTYPLKQAFGPIYGQALKML